MAINRETIEQLRHLIRPIATRVANIVSRAVVQLADDTKNLLLLQLGVLADETVDDAEYHQPYGFSSVPLAGAEAVVVFPSGDRAHPLVIGASDRRYRPTNAAAGAVTMYHYKGAKVTMLDNGNILLQPGPGGQVVVDDGNGGTGPLVTQAQFMNHTHVTAGTGAPTPPSTLSPTPTLTGTTLIAGK